MVSDRVTVSLDDNARSALENLVTRTGQSQSEIVREALTFYAANFQATNSNTDIDLGEYHKMLSSGEHVLLDIDFLHCLLDNVKNENDEPDPEFLKAIDQVSEYHAREFEQRFSRLEELLDWLSVCGFLTVRQSSENTYHVVFPTEETKWFMTRFIRKSTKNLPFDLEIENAVSKVLITEIAT